ncbi:MAG: hypothetical protein JXB14_04855 [Candidatus Altiarchaeota archaeon]|nr:hypothetical protein [Candidatus Altiarchaeota archaeon]
MAARKIRLQQRRSIPAGLFERKRPTLSTPQKMETFRRALVRAHDNLHRRRDMKLEAYNVWLARVSKQRAQTPKGAKMMRELEGRRKEMQVLDNDLAQLSTEIRLLQEHMTQQGVEFEKWPK